MRGYSRTGVFAFAMVSVDLIFALSIKKCVHIKMLAVLALISRPAACRQLALFIALFVLSHSCPPSPQQKKSVTG